MSSPFATIRAALGLAALLGGLGLSGGAWAQESKLQACPTSEFVRWDNCFGTHTHEGNKYIGEWVSNKYDGLGTLIYRGGAIYSGEFKENIDKKLAVMTLFSSLNWMPQWYDPKSNIVPEGLGQQLSDMLVMGLKKTKS